MICQILHQHHCAADSITPGTQEELSDEHLIA